MGIFREWLKEGNASIINVQQALQGKPPEWVQIISRFPEMLQKEILDERPNPNKEDIQFVGSWRLANNTPVSIDMSKLLQNKENQDTISGLPPHLVQEINQIWGLNIQPGKVYDTNIGRYKEYMKMPGNTASPSSMINGIIEFGLGRFIAALLRGDKQLMVWDIRT